jgi:hypothetical protein
LDRVKNVSEKATIVINKTTKKVLISEITIVIKRVK